jgi:hypothetical protein
VSADAAPSPAAVDARSRPPSSACVPTSRLAYDEPEIGFEEHASVARIAALLAAHGVDAEVGAFGLDTALRATAGADAAASGPHFAIIAEYDALPGIGHACGHNVIAAVAGRSSRPRRWSPTSADGCRSSAPPRRRTAAARSSSSAPAGSTTWMPPAWSTPRADRARVPCSASARVRRVAVTFHGRAAHAAGAPWLGRNALDGVVTAYQSVAQLRQHILPTDRLHGIITDGGAAPNIVPERASALFYVRSADVGRCVSSPIASSPCSRAPRSPRAPAPRSTSTRCRRTCRCRRTRR